MGALSTIFVIASRVDNGVVGHIFLPPPNSHFHVYLWPYCSAPLMVMILEDEANPVTYLPRPPSSSALSFPMFSSFLVVTICVLLSSSSFAAAACNQGDQDSLISILSNLSSSPPLNWSSTDCCNWEGIDCDTLDGRVVHLSLPSRYLSGTLSSTLGNLTRLSYLNLSHNGLSGSLPPRLFSSRSSLQVLDLSYNHLTGELPSYASNNTIPIQKVDLSSNHFSGPILVPGSFLQAAWNLTSFNVSNNSFTGQIPSDICSGAVSILDFSFNDFSGSIYSGLGECSRLEIFRAGFNNLSGELPDDIFRVDSLLEELSLPVNHLSGPLNDALGNLSNLKILELYSNELIGVIPQSIGKLSQLKQLLLHFNQFQGFLPSSLMNCTKLVTVNLRVNSLQGDLSAFDFSRLLQLTTLDLGNNNFSGNLPESLYMCTSLTAVRLASNQLEGQVLPGITALQALSYLSLSANNLANITGAVQVLMGCKNLKILILSNNTMTEAVLDDVSMVGLTGFQNLQLLALGRCNLSGPLPSWLADLRSLEVLDLSLNQITGFIPSWLGNLPSLFYLDLSNNFLLGEFPKALTGLQALASAEAYQQVDRSYLELPMFVMPYNATNQQYNQISNMPPAIYLGNNSLSGPIPPEIGQLKCIHVLDLNNNNFSGSIPSQLSNLTNLERLDLSSNHLSGEIPASLNALHFLSWFSVASNNLQGPIPSGGQFDTFSSSSFIGNPGLCGSVLQRSCSSTPPVNDSHGLHHERTNIKLVVGLVLGICFGTGLFVAVLVVWILSKRRIIPGGDIDHKIELDTISINSYLGHSSENDKDTSLVVLFPNDTNDMKDLNIYELLKATENFNQANIVGCGGFGLVYKAILRDGTKLAVKKLSGDMGLMEREFKAEVEALSTAQHENLVSLRGYCIHEGFRLLIYSYMENGSLDYWLHEKIDGASQLDWPTRLNIARGASCGLAYMHQICEPHIVHRDIKSSNILLDEKFEAHVADFGLSRLILPYQTHVTTELVGTLGYIPPEYGQAWVATLRGDVYSFGVMMLELLTGKRPVEVFKPKISRELVGWVQQMRNEGKQELVFDPILKGKGFDDEMLQVLDLACMCVNHNSFKRPIIKEVVDRLKNVGSQQTNHAISRGA